MSFLCEPALTLLQANFPPNFFDPALGWWPVTEQGHHKGSKLGGDCTLVLNQCK